MNIPNEFLKESEYAGTRLIEINDERVIELNNLNKRMFAPR